ncbi:MAG TPA: FAD-dependent oxidoreductase, partial [Steroidobacteraceae bacterium]|nr:FAD-dependent oxidoreductase [Steroidobacteraceae bacterium]
MSKDWQGLRARIRGALLLPQDTQYEVSRHVWNAAIDRRPAAILICADDGDVVQAVKFATAQGIKATVRCGGHNVAGRAVMDGALLIDLSRIRQVRIDGGARRAEVGGGATWAVFDSAASKLGLATTGGMVSSTGVGGLTLGGG